MSLPITARCLLSPLLHSPLPTYPSPSNLKFLRPFSTSLPKSIPVTLASDSYPPPLPSSSSSSTAGIEGNKGPLIILHGLYGSKQNWRSLSKTLAKNLNREVIAVDLRNHGTSPHSSGISYLELSEDVNEFIEKKNLKEVILMGHSMGGKVAMSFALSNPEKLSKLIVLDIAPGKGGKISSEFKNYLTAMKEIDSLEVKSRKEADSILEKYEPDLSIRQFLLTNLEKPKGGKEEEFYKFRLPLNYLTKALEEIGDFPFDSNQNQCLIPSLFLKGARSKYINKHNLPIIKDFFPEMKLEILDTGHWVHAEKPREFVDLVVEFCK